MSKLIPVWWAVITGLVAALLTVVTMAISVGRQMAVLDRLPTALERLERHEVRLSVLEMQIASNTKALASVKATPLGEGP